MKLRLLLSLSVFVLFADAIEAQTPSISLQVAEPSGQALGRTLNQLRELRAGGNNGPVRIELSSGKFYLSDTIRITPELVGQGLTFQAIESGKAVLSGGRLLEPATRDDQGNWRLPLPEGWEKIGIPRVLVIDGKLCTAAHHPNEGYLRVKQSLPDRRSGFTVNEGDLPAEFDPATGICDLVFLHDWSISRLPVASFDKAQQELKTVGPIGCAGRHFAIDHFEKQPRYRLEGHAAFADLPGEWYVDRQQGAIVLKADPGVDAKLCPNVVLPWLVELLVAEGADGAPIRNLKLQGIEFTESRFPMPPGGVTGLQATVHEARDASGQPTDSRAVLASAVRIDFGEGCQVNNCNFRALGGGGLWFGRQAKQCRAFRCNVDDVGGNGLAIGEDRTRQVEGRDWWAAAPEQVPFGNVVSQCSVSNCGRLMFGAVGIWATITKKTEIAENRLHDCPYTGISLGWIWNDAKSPAGENLIRDNQIEFTMQSLSDGGGIYILGRQPNSVIENNFIADVPANAGRAESNGMFLDQGSSGFTIRGNTIRRIDRSPLRFHQAVENVVVNNRWELATPETPPIRYNRTPEENIKSSDNETLSPQIQIYCIGNSLTWDTIPPRLDEAVHWHVDCGKPLTYIFAHPEHPCVGTSRLWPIALRTTQYDFVTCQTHGGTTVEEDLAVISTWMELQKKAVFVIHTGWARPEDVLKEYADEDPSGPLTHSPAHINELLRRLKEKYPAREFRCTHAMDLLHQIALDIQAQQAPLKDLKELYRDAIHMTIGPGRYLMHNAMRRTLGQPCSSEGFPEFDPALKAYLDALLVKQFGEQ